MGSLEGVMEGVMDGGPIMNSECCGSRQVDQIEVSGSMGFIGEYIVILL